MPKSSVGGQAVKIEPNYANRSAVERAIGTGADPRAATGGQ
jgi:hypothetical protein